MDDRFILKLSGTVVGTFACKDVREMVANGQITRFHMISLDGGETWLTVRAAFPNHLNQDASSTDQSEEGNDQPTSDSGSEWFCVMRRSGESDRDLGPMDLKRLRRLFQKGDLEGTDLVWNASFADWTQARLVEELSDIDHARILAKQVDRENRRIERANRAPFADRTGTSLYSIFGFILSLLWVFGVGSVVGMAFGIMGLSTDFKLNHSRWNTILSISAIFLGIIGIPMSFVLVPLVLELLN